MTEPPRELHELESLAREAAASLSHVSRSVTQNSLVGAGNLQMPAVLLMPGAQFEFRIYFSVTKTGRFLWFRSKENQTIPLIDASITFALLPASRVQRSPRLDLAGLNLMALLPEFLVAPETFWTSGEGVRENSDLKSALAFRLRDGVLAVRARNVKTPDESDLRFFSKDGTEVPMKSGVKWMLDPFLQFLDTLEAWIANPKKRSRTIAVDDLKRRLEGNDFGRLLKASLETVLAASEGAATQARPEIKGSVFNDLIPNYFVDQAKLALMVMLEEDGTLPELRDKETYQLRAEIDLEALSTAPSGTALMFPPDFVASGEMRRQFLVALGEEAFWSDGSVVEAFGRNLDPHTIRDLLRASETRITIFRTKRRPKGFDTNVIVVRGEIEGLGSWLFFLRTRFRYLSRSSRFEYKGGSTVRIVRKSLGKIGYDLDDGTVRYLYHLMRAMRRWVDFFG